MGAYLSEPITSKDSEDGEGNQLKYGASCMQGWRVSQEDAHNCVGKFDNNTSLFGVYDGHGGAEVAIYLARHLPEFLKKNSEYINGGDMKMALHNTYLSIDESIKSKEAQVEIQHIAKNKDNTKEEVSVADFEEENVCALYEEATMPLEALVAKYHSDKKEIPVPESSAEERPCSSRSLLSPKLPKRKQELKAEDAQPTAGESADAGSSSSTNGEKETKPNENGEAKITSPEDEAETENGSELKSTPSEDLVKTPIKGERKNGETESHEQSEEKQDDEISELKSAETTKDLIVQKQHVNGDGNKELDTPSIGSKSADKDEEPESTKCKGDDGEIIPELPVMGSSALSAVARIKRHIYQSLVTTTDSGSDMSDSDEDDSFHVPRISFGEDDDSSDEEMMNSGSSDDEENEDEDEELEDDDSDEQEEDDDFMNDSQEPGFDSGSTSVVALLKWEAELLHLWVANAGDSRCVVSRGGKALDMSKDHKPEEEVEAKRIVQAGGKVTADGRVNGGLNLSRALGDHSYKQNQSLTPEEQMITPVPDVEHIILDPQTDNFIVLACDGIWNSMTSQQVVDFVSDRLTTKTKLSEVCEELFDTCLARDTAGDGTGCDNMTAVIIRVEKPKTAKRELTEASEEQSKRLKLDTEEKKTSTT